MSSNSQSATKTSGMVFVMVSLQGAYLKMRKVVKSISFLEFVEFYAENWSTHASECCLKTLFQRLCKKMLFKDGIGPAVKAGGFAIRASNKKQN